jgi:ferredoxin
MVRQFRRYSIDISREPILVYPTLHYQNGGITIDVNGATGVPGLFAAGECTAVCTGGTALSVTPHLISSSSGGGRAKPPRNMPEMFKTAHRDSITCAVGRKQQKRPVLTGTAVVAPAAAGLFPAKTIVLLLGVIPGWEKVQDKYYAIANPAGCRVNRGYIEQGSGYPAAAGSPLPSVVQRLWHFPCLNIAGSVSGHKECLGCGNCVDICPLLAREPSRRERTAQRTSMALESIVGEDCDLCNNCILVCPQVDTTLKHYVVNHRMVEVMSRIEARIGDENEPDIDLFLEEAIGSG